MSRFTPIDLSTATCAVTGGARGIGRAIAEALMTRGATVHIGDLDGDLVQATAAEIGARGWTLDVTRRDSFGAFVESCGPLDLLVNNAGIMPAGRFLEESDATAEAICGVNLLGPTLGMKLALPGMLARGRGHVVNVASYAGRFAIPGLASYCASKAAVLALAEVVAAEIAGSGVSISSVLPSAVNTELSSGIPFPFARVAKVEPETVAAAVIGTLKDRPLEAAVPGWLAAYEPLTALMPARVERALRHAVDDRRALDRVDVSGRAAYRDRLARQMESSR